MSARKRATENQAADARLEELRQRDLAAEEGGGAERREKQHQAGKLSARERIELLLDPESFEELDKFVLHRCDEFGMEEQRLPGDGIVSGYGRIAGGLVSGFSPDLPGFAGRFSEGRPGQNRQ